MEQSPRNPYRSCIVDASAGTGKTYQLSRRFLFLVAAHAEPSEILTITFTRKARSEMRARIIAFASELASDRLAQQEFDREMSGYYRQVGDNYQPPKSGKAVGEKIFNQSQRLKISTFDSLFREWIASFASQGFAVPYPFKMMSAEKIAEYQRQSWQHLWRNYRNNLSLHRDLQDYGVFEPQRALLPLQKFLRQGMALANYNQNDKKISKINKLNDRGQLYYWLAGNWQKIYQRRKAKYRELEFDDLLETISQLLNQDAGALFYLQNRISHLLLDEFQDTNDRQWSIFNKMAQELLAGDNIVAANRGLQSTLFIVGDGKQSIYGFRDANPAIIKQAGDDLNIFKPDHHQLLTSYRTASHLLDFFNIIFAGLKLENFSPHHPAKDRVANRGEIVISDTVFAELADEANFVADYIEQTLNDNDDYQAGDFCVLYRNSKDSRFSKGYPELLAEALAGKKIASQRFDEKFFFNNQVIKDLLALCKWLATPNDSQALSIILRSPIARLSEDSLLKVCKINVVSSWQLLEELADHSPNTVNTLHKLIEQRGKQPAYTLLLSAIFDLQVLSAYHSTVERDLIIKFIDLVMKASIDGVGDFASLTAHLEELATTEEPNVKTTATAVSLMTIHKAKGLEFKCIILVGSQEPWSRDDTYWLKTINRKSVSYVGKKSPDRPTARQMQGTALEQILNDRQHELLAEEQRLLYVALTRAQYRLVISGTRAKRTNHTGFLPKIVDLAKENNFSRRQLFGVPVLIKEQLSAEVSGDQPSKIPTTRPSLVLPPPPLNQEIKILLPHQKKTTQTTVTTEPLTLVYGSYIHKALECRVTEQPMVDASYWQQLLASHRLQGSYEARWRQAQRTLQNLLDSDAWREIFTDHRWAKAEMKIVALDNDELIRGTIDLLVAYPNNRLLIVDYKTMTSDPQKISDYQPQLSVYCRAVQKLYPDHQIDSALLFSEDYVLSRLPR